MISLGTQYYRPPFPNEKYWDGDLAKMADSGLNTVQLWVKWGWVEPEPDTFRFEDYDRLVELADKHGLKVVLSTIAAIHPYWIHRVVPGSEMIDNMGNRVISSNRVECHFGLTPGGCFDHPGVWKRMAGFLTAVTERYRDAANLLGWDCWNEIRWCVQADGLVCYCPHTLKRFHEWLDRKYGGLDGLNKAWQRRYTAWEDVMPGKMPRSPYTEMMAFEHFITWRTNEHAADRYRLMKKLDPEHPVTIHGAYPSVVAHDGYPITALHRGSDWALSDVLDGVGTSSFPHWGGMDDFDYACRIGYTASAAQDKRIWLSEVQGGRAASGFHVHTPVPPAFQQRWVWVGISRGADAVLFWCWRDEVFGKESAGFGLDGADGHREARLAAMQITGGLLDKHKELLTDYRPDRAEAGIYFSPQSYYLHWIEDRHAGTAIAAVEGYARALLRRHIPFRIVEEDHLHELDGLKILFLPRTLVVDDKQAEALSDFVRNGGTLVCESECGAFGSNGLYRYPEDRFLAELTGVKEIGRRSLPESGTITCRLGGEAASLAAMQWLTPFASGGEVLGESEDGPVLVSKAAGSGRVVLCGTYLGQAYHAEARGKGAVTSDTASAFERLVGRLCRDAGVEPLAEHFAGQAGQADRVHLAAGSSGAKRLLFVFAEEGKPLRLGLRNDLLGRDVEELISGTSVTPAEQDADTVLVELPASEWGVYVLVSQVKPEGDKT